MHPMNPDHDLFSQLFARLFHYEVPPVPSLRLKYEERDGVEVFTIDEFSFSAPFAAGATREQLLGAYRALGAHLFQSEDPPEDIWAESQDMHLHYLLLQALPPYAQMVSALLDEGLNAGVFYEVRTERRTTRTMRYEVKVADRIGPNLHVFRTFTFDANGPLAFFGLRELANFLRNEPPPSRPVLWYPPSTPRDPQNADLRQRREKERLERRQSYLEHLAKALRTFLVAEVKLGASLWRGWEPRRGRSAQRGR